jgi:putative transposase
MSRLRRIENADRYFFLTTNIEKNIRALDSAERDLCLTELSNARAKHKFSLFAYVIMPTHAHVLIWTSESLLPAIMREWKGASGYAISKLRNRKGAVWQPRYFDFILRRAADFAEKVAYIHNNPVVAGPVTCPGDWLWSSAAFYARKANVPIQPDLFEMPVDPNTPLWPVPWR